MLKKVSELLPRSAIILELNAKEKEAAIKELAAPLVQAGFVTDEAQFVSAILRRENLESTGIGFGVAIPHARTNAAVSTVLAFGRSSTGVDFSSLDGKPSHLIFLIASPETMKREYIWTLAKLSSLLRRDEVRNGLTKAQTVDEVYSIIERYERY
ncbi:PTS sugar transporter subunit IIA [candidate division WOR-3 bacterium]|jgi:PTS system fructose-specific IIC component|nr:PTS sugar transporter subunit IIA [candidate division WOR-3 bacterium]